MVSNALFKAASIVHIHILTILAVPFLDESHRLNPRAGLLLKIKWLQKLAVCTL